MPETTSFGCRLRRARIARRLSQAEVAQAIGVARSSIATWETGRGNPEFVHLEPLARSLGASLNWLILGEGRHTLDTDRAHGAARMDRRSPG